MRTCLVVDDSSVIRKVARRILEGLDFQIVEAEDGEKAIEACKRAMPEAVLLDWNMPEVSGIEVVEKLRSQSAFNGVRLLMVTTETEIEQMARALEAGADEYVMKPFTREAVEDKLRLIGVLP